MLLTQTQIDFSQEAGAPGQARVTITADVLRDYGAQNTSSPAPSTLNPATQQAALLSYLGGTSGGGASGDITTAVGGLGGIT
jgi:hypothetical protein